MVGSFVAMGATPAAASDGDGHGQFRVVQMANAHDFTLVPGSFAALKATGPAKAQTLTLYVHAAHLQAGGGVSVRLSVYDQPELCVPQFPTPLDTVCAPPNRGTPGLTFLALKLPNIPASSYDPNTVDFVYTIPGTHPKGAEVQFAIGFLNIPNADGSGFAKELAYFGDSPNDGHGDNHGDRNDDE